MTLNANLAMNGGTEFPACTIAALVKRLLDRRKMKIMGWKELYRK